MTKQDRLTLIAFMRERKEALKRKADSCALLLLWFGLRIVVHTAPCKHFLRRLCSQSVEMARSFRQRILARLLYLSAARLFNCAAGVLSAAAIIRSRSILAARSIRTTMTSAQGSSDCKALRKSTLRIAERVLWIIAAATLGYCSYAYASAAIHQHQQKTAFEALQAGADPVLASAKQAAVAMAETPAPGEVLGIIDIPRIGLSSVVEQGVDSSILRDNVGHLPGTALPGQKGNAALAAHRDTYFRHLSELHSGDEIIFHSISATYTYRVRSTSIVEPTDTTVLANTTKPTLTLVTCFPFYYVGSAPKRFILVATEVATEVATKVP